MAFSNTIDPTEPLGSAFVKNGDDELRQLKTDIIERFNSAFQDVQSDPLTLKNGYVVTAMVLDNAITTSKIANGAVTAAKVTVTALSDFGVSLGTVTGGKLQNTGGSRYINVDATGGSGWLIHPALSLFGDGTASYGGSISSDTFSSAYSKFSGEISALTRLQSGRQDTTYTAGPHGVDVYGKTAVSTVGIVYALNNVDYNTTNGTSHGFSSTYGANVATGELYVAGVPVAKVIASTSAASGVAPEGTIWVQY